jgi:hypothetical protein
MAKVFDFMIFREGRESLEKLFREKALSGWILETNDFDLGIYKFVFERRT